jgi:hypothetical protein
MPDLRELLRDAAPVAARDLDVSVVRARVRQRARRRRALVGGGVALVLAFAVGVSAAVVRDDDPPRRIDVVDDSTTTIPAPSTTVAPVQTAVPEYTLPSDVRPRAIVADGASIWVGGHDSAGYAVWKLDRTTGDVLARVALPGAVRGMVGGESVIWVWGGGDGGEPVGGVAAIDRETARVAGTFGWDGAAPESEWHSTYDLDATGDTAWVSDATHDRVFRLRPTLGTLESNPVPVGRQPTDVVALTDGSVWVNESMAGTIARIDMAALEVTERHGWTGGLVAGSGDLIWAYIPPQLVELLPTALADGLSASLGARLTGLGFVNAVIRDATGLWIVNDSGIRRYDRSGGGDPVLRSHLPLPYYVSGAAADGERILFVHGETNVVAAWTPTPS